MIKILNIISDKNIGGAGRCVLNFLKYYDRKNFRVKVVVPKGSLLKPEIEKLHTEVIEAEGIGDKSFDLKGVLELKKVIKRLNPDIVHTHGTLSGRIAAKECGKKIVYTRHSVFPVSERIKKGPGRKLNQWVNEFLADEIIAVAEAAKENLTEGGISPKKIQVILNGVEKVKPLSPLEIEKTKAQYGILPDDFVVGILARLEEVKGHRYLIEAAELFREKKIKILIIGTGSLEERLKESVKERHLEQSVIFTGFLSDVQPILNSLDVQVNASFGTEATSLSLLEGMSLGIPAVVSDYGGNPGVITQGENGLIFPIKNSEALAEDILRLKEDRVFYERLQTGAKRIFKEKFTAQIYAKNIENVYRKMMEKEV